MTRAESKALSHVPDLACVTITYEGKKRRVRPAYIIFTKEHPYPFIAQWWLRAYDFDAREQRMFAMANIKEWKR